MARRGGKQGPCKICHNFCKGGKPDECRVYVWNDCFKSAVFPCNAREYVNKNSTEYLRFESNGRKYSVDISKWRIKTIVSGNAWEKFIADNNLGGGGHCSVVCLSKRLRTATILNSHANPAPETDEMIVDEVEEVVYADKRELVAEHSKGVHLKRDEQDKLNAFILGYNMDYEGTPFVHRFSKTNIAAGNVKLPCRLAKILGIPKQGMLGVSSGDGGSESVVSYTTSSDGRIIFRKDDWMKFVLEHSLEADKHAMLYFKTPSNPQLKLDMVVCKI